MLMNELTGFCGSAMMMTTGWYLDFPLLTECLEVCKSSGECTARSRIYQGKPFDVNRR